MTFEEWWASHGTFEVDDAARCLELWNAATAEAEKRAKEREAAARLEEAEWWANPNRPNGPWTLYPNESERLESNRLAAQETKRA